MQSAAAARAVHTGWKSSALSIMRPPPWKQMSTGNPSSDWRGLLTRQGTSPFGPGIATASTLAISTDGGHSAR
jgi:hypothetical protein